MLPPWRRGISRALALSLPTIPASMEARKPIARPTISGQRRVTPQPGAILGTTQGASLGAVDAPSTQGVSGESGSGPDAQAPIGHRIVQDGKFRAWKIGMGNEFHLHLAEPLDIVIDATLGQRNIRKNSDGAEVRQDEIPERGGPAVEGPDVPTQAVVSKGERNDLPLGHAAGRQNVGHGETVASAHCSGHRREHLDGWPVHGGRILAGHQAARSSSQPVSETSG